MIKSLKDNPILTHQIRHARWPSLRTAVLIAVGLTVIGLALILVPYIITPDSYLWIYVSSRYMVQLELLLLISGPPITAVVAVIATRRAIDSENYQIIRLSQVLEKDIVKGFAAGTEFQLRGFWMVVGGLVLPWIAAMTISNENLDITYACFNARIGYSEPYVYCSRTITEHVGAALFTAICFGSLCAAWCRLAANFGIWMAFRLRNIVMALAWTFVPLIIIMPLPVRGFWPYLYITDYHEWLARPPLISYLFYMGISIMLGWIAQQRAMKCVGKTAE